MKDIEIISATENSTVLNMKLGTQYAEIVSGTDEIGRFWVVPFFGKTYCWQNAKMWAKKAFSSLGYKSARERS